MQAEQYDRTRQQQIDVGLLAPEEAQVSVEQVTNDDDVHAKRKMCMLTVHKSILLCYSLCVLHNLLSPKHECISIYSIMSTPG